MKKYNLRIITATETYTSVVCAKSFSTTTNNSTSSGYYSFFDERNLVACYPIGRTIIESIEKID